MSRNPVVKFFASLKLTLFILFSIATTSIIGTVIPQELPRSQYIQHFKPSTFKILDFFGLFDMYHSWWFLTLLALLILNLIFCSLKHYKVTFSRVFNENLVLTPKIEKTILHKNDFSISRKKFDIQKIKEFIKKELSSNFYVEEEENKYHFFINKNKFSDFGYYIVHLSLIIIAIGAIIGSIYGFKGFMNIPVGETKDFIFLKKAGFKKLDFKIKCLDFKIDFYPNGTPKEYRSVVEVIDKNKKFKANIRVNHPLHYKGIKFFQASYGTTGQKVEIIVKDRKERKIIFNKKVRVGDAVTVNNNLQFVVDRFSDNFQGFGPTAKIVLLKERVPTKSFFVFQKFPDFDEKHRSGDYIFYLNGFDFVYYTGLQVAKDPGVNIVWLGCLLMIIGLWIAFFIFHKKFWIRVEETDKKVNITFAGSIRKNRLNFDEEFNKKFEKLKNIFIQK